MASINTRLTTFAQQELVISYSDAEREKLKASVAQLTKVLKDGLGSYVKEFIPFGSFTRNTILPRKFDPQSDVDIMVLFSTDLVKRTPGTYRKNILDVVAKAYPLSSFKKDFPAVKLELNHIIFDLVPGYSEQFLHYGSKYYYIPDSGDSWRETVPNDINEPLIAKNKSIPNNVVRNVIRLCKCWNAGANYPLESYLMEKQIIDSVYSWRSDLYEQFLAVLDTIAGQRAGVREALNWIKQYQGNFYRQPNEEKEFEWVQRLLPGLK